MTTPVFIVSLAWSAKAAVLNHLAPDTGFVEDNFSMDKGWGAGGGLWMIHVHYIYCALYFYYYYISSTSDYQAFDPGGRGPLS